MEGWAERKWEDLFSFTWCKVRCPTNGASVIVPSSYPYMLGAN
jgi:hypothetical protein